MADEIKLKAPTVEQQVVVNINGEEKLRSFADTLEKISNNKNLQKYWKTQQELINATADAYGNFSKKASQDNAKELIKVTNALKAMSGTDLSNILPDFDKISKAMAEAQKVAGNIDSAFSVKGFKEAFDSFETLKAYGVDIQNLFSHFGVSSDVGELQKNVRSLEGEVEKLTRRLANAKNANEELRNEFDNFKSGSGFADKLDELDNLKSEMSYLREQAEETFRQFLKLNNITEDGYDRDGFYDDNRFKEYFQNIQSGYLSASDAIQQFKREYSYLLDDSFKSNNDTFGLEQLQAFSNKLDSIFRQVEETSTKINDIISNGVITKSVENLSMDSSLSDSQRSLFGNLLQDEESLKSITALFQKLIEESNKTKNSELFNSEQLQQVLSIFDRIENSLSSLRSVISDVGDGEEFSPLLKALNDIKEAASNIKLNFNMDLGDEVSERLNQKVSQASARQLEAYRKLFSAMKGTGKTNKEMLKFFEPDESSVTELIGTYKGIIERAEKQFKVGNSNIYKKYLGAEYDALKREITNANKQLSRADSKRSENGILGDLFGNTKDLSEVIEQLNKIVSKLDEISSSASELKNVFKEGFNITASVEEIDKLTNRVKELEDELSKIKLNPVGTDKSNISSENNLPALQQEESQVEDINEDLEKQSDLYKQIYDRIEKIRALGMVGANKKDNDDLANSYGAESRNAEAYKMQMEAIKMLSPTGEMNPDIRDMVLNYELSLEEVAKKLVEAAEEYLTCKNALDEMFAKAGIVGGKIYDDAYRNLSMYSIDSEGMFGVIGETREKLALIKSENNAREEAKKKKEDESQAQAELNREKIEEARIQAELTHKKISGEKNQNGILSGDISTVQAQEDIREELKQTQIQAEKTEQSIKDVSSTTSPIEDVFQGDKIDQVTTSAKELDNTLEQVNIPTDSFDEVLSKLDLAKSELGEIVKITKQSVSDSEGKFHDSYTLKDKRGSTEIYGLSSNTEKGQLLRSNIVGYDAKEIEKANKQILKSEQELQAQKDAFHKKNISAIDLEIQKREEESKKVSSALKTQMEERQKQLSSMESSLKSYQDKAFDLSIKPDEANRFPEYQAQLDSINKAIKDYEIHINSLQNKGVIDPSDIDEANRLEEIIKNLLKDTKKFSSGDKGFTNIGADKVLEKINSILEQNSRMSKTAKDQIKAYYNEIYSGNPTRPLNEILDDVYKIVQAEREAGRAGKSWLDIFKDKKIYSFIGQAASMFSFYDLISLGREGFQTIRELDTALTEMKKVSDETTQSLKNYQATTFDVGDTVGATAKTIQESTADWMRLGRLQQKL